MNREPKRIRSLALGNGLTLKLYDASRRLAGDRWRVRLVAKIEIPVTAPSHDGPNENALRQVLGEFVVYRQVRDRHFVDAGRRREALEILCRDFLDAQLAYLSHPDFGSRFIRRAYHTCRERRSWYADV